MNSYGLNLPYNLIDSHGGYCCEILLPSTNNELSEQRLYPRARLTLLPVELSLIQNQTDLHDPALTIDASDLSAVEEFSDI